MEEDFSLDLGQPVKLKLSGQSGEVTGRVQHLESGTAYYVRYVNAAGDQVKDWFDRGDLS